MTVNRQARELPGFWLLAKTFLVVFPVLVFVNPPLFASDGIRPKNVLVMASYKPTLPVAYQWDQGLRSVFEADPAVRIDMNIEHLDLAHFDDDRYVQLLLDLYRQKYSKSKPDLVIPLYNGALGFVLRYGPDLFPGVPVVFGGVEKQFVEGWTLGPNITGVLSVNSYTETLDLALRLHPDTSRVAVVAGADIIGREWSTNARKAFRNYEDRVDFIDLTGRPMKDILEKVANLPGQTVVIYITLLKDGAGETFDATEALSQISRVSSAPVYSFWDIMLGHGMVGGYLSSAEERGKEVAQVGLRILEGAKPAEIPLADERGLQYKFDWRQLKRWSINEDRLPPDSIVQFKEFSFWEQYKGRIIVVTSVLVLQLGLIAGLLINIGRRRRIEKERDERMRFEGLIAQLSSKFINFPVDQVDQKITDGLSRIGTFMNVDRSFLFRFNRDKTEFHISHLWEADGIQRDQIVRGVTVKEFFPWLADNILNGKDIVVSDVEELAALEDARSEYEYCRQMGIRSFLILAIQVEDLPLCAIGLDSIHSGREWPDEVKSRLRLIGELFANAILRKHAEENLKASEQAYRIVADFTHDWEYWIGPDEKSMRYVSPSVERITGYPAREFMEHAPLRYEIVVPEDREVWSKHYQDEWQRNGLQQVQYRIRRRDGAIRWIEHACKPVTGPDGEFLGRRVSNRDITMRKESEDGLRASQEELRHLAGRLLTAQEVERRRLARELHDDITQRLAVVSIEAGKLERDYQHS